MQDQPVHKHVQSLQKLTCNYGNHNCDVIIAHTKPVHYSQRQTSKKQATLLSSDTLHSQTFEFYQKSKKTG